MLIFDVVMQNIHDIVINLIADAIWALGCFFLTILWYKKKSIYLTNY